MPCVCLCMDVGMGIGMGMGVGDSIALVAKPLIYPGNFRLSGLSCCMNRVGFGDAVSGVSG